MAHKTLVGGTAYEVKGGRCLEGGTAYSIQKGRALVGGTGYDVSFGSDVVGLYIFGTGSSNRGNVTVGDTKYTEGNHVMEVNAGDSITFVIGSDDSTETGTVYINGEKYTSKAGGSVSRSWTVPDDCRFIKIVLYTHEYEDDEGYTMQYCETDVTTYEAEPIYAEITGSGSSSYCYVTLNNVAHSSETSDLVVWHGDEIRFTVYGRSATYYGEVVIDGTQVLQVTTAGKKSYTWTVPDGVVSISIAMKYTNISSQRRGCITVTTT